jgi:hypothetical protein
VSVPDVRSFLRALLLVLAAGVTTCAPSLRHVEQHRGSVPAQKRAPAARAPRETAAKYRYYFDRNALASSVVVGSNVIALTRSGHVLGFDKASLALAAEQSFPRRARVLGGVDATGVLVGFDGGRIARIDAASFSTETVTTVPGTPMWVGRSNSGEPVVVFASRKRGTGPRWRAYENYRIWLGARRDEAPIVLPTEERIGGPAETFFLDDRDRLWRGTDRGEWGGNIEVVDLRSGQAQSTRWDGSGVYGFAESRDGRVLAFGGVSHMGYLRSFVANVEPDHASFLYAYRGMGPFAAAPRKRWIEAPEPHLPITHVLERDDGTFWLLSFHHLIAANPRFGRFRRIHDFSLRYTPGRPDAVGSYPAVASAVLDGDRLLLATRNDGLVEYTDGRAIGHALPDQVADDSALCVPTPVGWLFLHRSGGSLLRRDGHWKAVELQLAQGEQVLVEPEVPITDSDILAARSAYETWLRRIRSKPGHPWRARVQWDERTDLLASEQGLCLQPRGTGSCSPLTLPGVDLAVTAFARDEAGRLWLAGEGLWVVGKSGRVVAVHSKLGFMTDSVVHHILAIDGTLVLSLGDRGVAVVDATTLGIDFQKLEHGTAQGPTPPAPRRGP